MTMLQSSLSLSTTRGKGEIEKKEPEAVVSVTKCDRDHRLRSLSSQQCPYFHLSPIVQPRSPPNPRSPPTLVNIADAIEYNRNIRISRGMFFFLYNHWQWHIFYLISSGAGGASKDDVARGAIYEAELVQENAGIGVYTSYHSYVYWFDTPPPTSRSASLVPACNCCRISSIDTHSK